MRAIEEGADFIKSEILASKDGVLICFHDVALDDTTDIANHKEFSNRKRTYEVQGENITGHFIVDFTLEELKAQAEIPFSRSVVQWTVCHHTFKEFISIALDAPRVVGIYFQMKNPVFINQHVKWSGGKKFEDKFVEALKKYGYKGSDLSKEWLKQPAFIQSFAPTSLTYVSKLTDLPKIFLIDDTTIPTQYINQSFWKITSDNYFDYIKEYVVGIGPWKDTLVTASNNYLQAPTDTIARAHAHNLQVHPYKEYDYWINKTGVDGLFTDFTCSLHQYQEWTHPFSTGEDDALKLLDKIVTLITKFKNT